MRIELVSPGPCKKQKIVISKLPAILGRGPDAAAHVDDSWVRQYQCMLEEIDGVLFVWDLGSRLGTFVNGRRITKGPVAQGDILTVGKTDLVVYYQRQPEACLATAAG